MTKKLRVPFVAPGESEDPLDYRENRNQKGQLNQRGLGVMDAFLRERFRDEAIAIFMDVTPQTVSARRKQLGLSYGHRTER
ncbi:MAG: hypothetical protein JOY71_15895 [Acetobacteraceae bacterium]|nr:hypothetical protein [Acetobacteraceae bacterium]MBV8523583.1 hypothetical protein [Acetobacteraceae bacterium]MBV8589319.1 hypothetical protein [Acetobacteraceae bacterium]